MNSVNVVALVWAIVIGGVILAFLFYLLSGCWALLVAIYYKVFGIFMARRIEKMTSQKKHGL